MVKDFLIKLFPVPKFLANPSTGLDISDHSIKFLQLQSTKNGLRISKFGEKRIPQGVMESGKIIDPEKLESIISGIKKEFKLDSVRVSLPEEQVYLFKLNIQKIESMSLKDSIDLQLEDYIPISASEAVFDYEIISEDEKSILVQIVAIAKPIIYSYLSVLKNSGLYAPGFELEADSVSRALVRRGDNGTYMILDFGEKRSGLLISSKGSVVFTSTIDIGGQMLTEVLQKALGVSFEEAEKIKRKNGLRRNVEQKEMFSIVLNSISVLRDEINKHFIYWQTHKDENGMEHPKIDKIIICGGDANLKGLVEYLSISMKVRVELADPWANVCPGGTCVPEVTANESLSFVTAIGLSLADFKND